MPSPRLNTVGVDLDHLAEGCLSGFSTVVTPFFPFHTVLLEGKSLP